WAQVVVQGVGGHTDTFDASQRWAGLKALAPQLQVCAGHVSAHHLDSDEALRLLQVYSGHLLEYGPFHDAAEPISAARALASSTHGSSHVEHARCVELQARLHHRRGEDAEAESLFRCALPILEESLGPHHLDVADLLNNLAEPWGSQAKYDEAELPFQRTIA